MTFYFYDLETSTGSSRNGRIMQFAGQRTNDKLELIGEPDNILVKLPEDAVPDPDAILVHRITPQQTLSDGISEAQFAEIFHERIAQPHTIFVGYNNVRFDDEFMRFMNYRNFYDPYEWHWKEGRSRWDLLDVVRMMRALRPDGLAWPELDGKPTVKLEEMAKKNNIIHENAHDALSDVLALITLAQKIYASQNRFFEFVLSNRDKKNVCKLAESGEPFIYTSGKYENEFLKTTIVQTVFRHPRREAAIVWDLRKSPSGWLDKSPEQLAKHWTAWKSDDVEPLPIKTMQYNRCPAVAPISVLDDASKTRIGYDKKVFDENYDILVSSRDFRDRLAHALDIVENEQQARLPLETTVDEQLYDGFWNESDKSEMLKIRHADPDDFLSLQKDIKNKRLRDLMPLYKARNYPEKMTSEERQAWDTYRYETLMKNGENSRLGKVSKRMQEIAKTRTLSSDDEYLLAELQLYIESIVPEHLEDS